MCALLKGWGLEYKTRKYPQFSVCGLNCGLCSRYHIQLLEELLASYNDGRRKGFFCIAVNLLDLADLISIMEQLTCDVAPKATAKEKAVAAVRLFQSKADEKDIKLKLRK